MRSTERVEQFILEALCILDPCTSHRCLTSMSHRRTHNDKNQAILKALLKETANRTCADCKTATHPRWASWNLGCFICIRCSGIHRSMGTHISRVKSVDLDSWTDEQMKSMVRWGNAKSNAFWEAKLPENHGPSDSKIDNFIRTKYEVRKWALSKGVPDPSTVSLEKDDVQKSIPAELPQPISQGDAQPAVEEITQPVPEKKNDLTESLLNLELDGASYPSMPMPKQTTSAASLVQSASQKNARPDLKKSILSLYSSPASSTPYLSNTSSSSQSFVSGTTKSRTPLNEELFKNVWNS